MPEALTIHGVARAAIEADYRAELAQTSPSAGLLWGAWLHYDNTVEVLVVAQAGDAGLAGGNVASKCDTVSYVALFECRTPNSANQALGAPFLTQVGY